MEIIFSQNFDFTEITWINRCRVYLQTLFFLDITTADGKYLEHFVFNLGSNTRCSRYTSRVHNHRRETENAAGGVDEPNSQDMGLVLQQRKGQAIPNKRDNN
jgi:hypothetical protein